VRHTHHLELTVADTPLVLDRIVAVCRARRCTIVALRFEAADRHRPGRVHATLEADPRRARLATQRLASLPGVLAVAAIGAGSERAEVHTAGVTERAVAAAARA
jgi:acetolactate synthase small subunit